MEKLDILTLSRIIRLFSQNTDGIQLYLFKQKYQLLYGSSYPYSSAYVINSLTGIGYIEVKSFDLHENSASFLCPTQKMLQLIYEKECVDDHTTSRRSKSHKAKGLNIQPMKIPEKVKRTCKCQVVVSCITKPQRFWFQIKGKEYSERLVSLEEDMTKFYWSSEGLKHALSDIEKKTLRNPKIVAAPFRNKIYRALVLSRPTDDNKINLLFVDYGNTSSLSVYTSSLFRLKAEYCELPCQGVLAHEVNLASFGELDMEAICQLDRIHPIYAHFEHRFDESDEYWPLEPLPVQLFTENNQTILSMLQETFNLLKIEEMTESEASLIA